MLLTVQQQNIINSTGNIKINAVAGSGKTTTIIEYARSRPKNSKILYLAFNRSVKIEAERKFRELGLYNVKVETAHSLAYKNIVFKHEYKVRAGAYRTHEIVEILGLNGFGSEKLMEYIIATHINRLITYFCNSDKTKVHDLHYPEIICDPKAKGFVDKNYAFIREQARQFLAKMDAGDIDVIHDFYLKKYQLSKPKLNYDFILFDEGQDASPAMLDVFLRQTATKVIVGDTHQQIYGWRHAINSLEKADYKIFNLSNSFRFSQDIANLAMEILKWKDQIHSFDPVEITGTGNSGKYTSKAVLARTNLGLLLKAIEYVTDRPKIKTIYFEGNINSYTYADEGASLYDILNLYNGKRKFIKDKLILQMNSLNELEEYIEKTEDVQLGMMVTIVKEYGNEIPDIIRDIKAKHIDGDDKKMADIIFSTVHRSKGMEYDAIQLANDFINKEKIEKLVSQSRNEAIYSKINEEINLLYVAVTRTRNSIHIPDVLLPDDFPASKHIFIEKLESQSENRKKQSQYGVKDADLDYLSDVLVGKTSYSLKKIREKHKEAYMPWNMEDDDELTIMFCEGKRVTEMAEYFGRTKGAIRARIKKLELKEKYIF